MPAPHSITLHASAHLREVDREAFVADLRAAAPAVREIRLEGDLLLAAQAAGARVAVRKASLALATGRIKDPLVPRDFVPAAPGEESFELKVDADSPPATLASLPGRLYDGERAARAAMALIPAEERATEKVHVWATRRLLVTYSSDDFRYHARYAVHGYPTVFSLLALRYAPAPSREAQLERMRLTRAGLPPEAVEQTVAQAFAHEAFDSSDAATVTRALASAALQAGAVAAGLQAFCEDPSCRLYNPHHSPEFVRSILGTRMCAAHRELFGAAP